MMKVNLEITSQKISKKEKGITLIALVITIVILIILATVAINAIFKDGGLIEQAEKAKDLYNNSAKDEEESMASLEDQLNSLIAEKGGSDTEEEPREVEGVTIPDGFYYVGGSKAEGIVISDKKEDLQKGTSHEVAQTLVGNQFVWIPIEDDEAFITHDGYYEGTLQNEHEDFSGYFDYISEPYTTGYSTEQSEYNAMKSSVLEHNGFYVGRYEAGTTATSERTISSGITDQVVIKQGKNVYNYVGWSDSNDMKNELGGAVQLSKEFAEKNGYTSVTSTLIYGVEWDAIMNFIDSGYSEGICTEDSLVRDSTGKGNNNEETNTNPWRGRVTITGASADYSIKNIYDLAGNATEWTMEANKIEGRVGRGRRFWRFRFLHTNVL